MAEKKNEDTQDTPQPKKDIRNVYQRMLAVAKDTDGVIKDKFNADQKYKYASHDAVVDAVRDAMIKHGVLYLVDTVSMEEAAQEIAGKYGARTVFIAKGHFQVITINADSPDDRYPLNIHMTAQDSGDKAGAKLLSYVKKYGLLACVGLLLPTGIDQDDDKRNRHGADDDDARERELDARYAEREQKELARTAAKKPQPAPKATAPAKQGEDTPAERKRLGLAMLEDIKGTSLARLEPWKKLQESLGEGAPKITDLSMEDYISALARFKNRARQFFAVITVGETQNVPDNLLRAAIESAGIVEAKWWTATTDQLVAAHDAVVKAAGKKPPRLIENEAEPEPREPGTDDDLPFGD